MNTEICKNLMVGRSLHSPQTHEHTSTITNNGPPFFQYILKNLKKRRGKKTQFLTSSPSETSLSRVSFLVQWTADPGWQLLKSFISIFRRDSFVVRETTQQPRRKGGLQSIGVWEFETKEDATCFISLRKSPVHAKIDVLFLLAKGPSTKQGPPRLWTFNDEQC